jgi:hypothetical protein
MTTASRIPAANALRIKSYSKIAILSSSFYFQLRFVVWRSGIASRHSGLVPESKKSDRHRNGFRDKPGMTGASKPGMTGDLPNHELSNDELKESIHWPCLLNSRSGDKLLLNMTAKDVID